MRADPAPGEAGADDLEGEAGAGDKLRVVAVEGLTLRVRKEG